MIRINQIKLSIEDNEAKILKLVSKKLKISEKQINNIQIVKKAIDSRDKNNVKYVYCVNVSVENETEILRKVNNNNIMLTKPVEYDFKPKGSIKSENRPIVVGMGPAGLFCTYLLAINGYKPLLIERGQAVDDRINTVNHFWETGVLDIESNVQFGEGGAGTFSDGKLNTSINDKTGRNRFVLETFVEHGAKENILYDSKPHIGTDILCNVVKNIRNAIIELGGEVRFSTKLTNIITENNCLKEIVVNDNETIQCDSLVLAIGHSARDTFKILNDLAMDMQAKSFAIGVRVEHPKEMINISQYGSSAKKLPAANYKLTYRANNGRSVYSFCMCPGGYVVNASSEQGMLAVNGMSYSGRDAKNSNSAIIASVSPKDFGEDTPLAGLEFQRKIEKAAYKEGHGKIPIQTFGDFRNNVTTKELGRIEPNCKGDTTFANLKNILPNEISESIEEAIIKFGSVINGFADADTLLAGVESRTSSPVRLLRDEKFQSNISGIYPCGEGAGYAGGITSAAIDGIKIFEAIAMLYKPK